ncbi:hypothetical protein Y032_0355g3328 [Ancylostoma ceylanicum]|uniref:Uncharacterized protein n=1 Tax=Ancylostoma ceylanicum TaxID=53326 RepID=A0A016RWF8_9BILA|nr:hypothetical protein Y032_0355g3328 [Ancylostoma ceylanicum]
MEGNSYYLCARDVRAAAVANVGDCCNGTYRVWDFAIGRRCWRSAVANISDRRPPSLMLANRGAILLEEYSGYLMALSDICGSFALSSYELCPLKMRASASAIL